MLSPCQYARAMRAILFAMDTETTLLWDRFSNAVTHSPNGCVSRFICVLTDRAPCTRSCCRYLFAALADAQ